jgi:hypothetical protein
LRTASEPVAVLNCDLAHSNLPSSSAFVPLLTELVESLLGQGGFRPAVLSGQACIELLPPEIATTDSLRVRSHDDPSTELVGLQLREEAKGVLLSWDSAGPPGVYEVVQEDKPIFALATAVPPEETDLMSISEETLRSRLSGGRSVSFHDATDESNPQDTAWTWLALACALCIVVEVGLLKAYRT